MFLAFMQHKSKLVHFNNINNIVYVIIANICVPAVAEKSTAPMGGKDVDSEDPGGNFYTKSHYLGNAC